MNFRCFTNPPLLLVVVVLTVALLPAEAQPASARGKKKATTRATSAWSASTTSMTTTQVTQPTTVTTKTSGATTIYTTTTEPTTTIYQMHTEPTSAASELAVEPTSAISEPTSERLMATEPPERVSSVPARSESNWARIVAAVVVVLIIVAVGMFAFGYYLGLSRQTFCQPCQLTCLRKPETGIHSVSQTNDTYADYMDPANDMTQLSPSKTIHNPNMESERNNEGGSYHTYECMDTELPKTGDSQLGPEVYYSSPFKTPKTNLAGNRPAETANGLNPSAPPLLSPATNDLAGDQEGGEYHVLSQSTANSSGVVSLVPNKLYST